MKINCSFIITLSCLVFFFASHSCAQSISPQQGHTTNIIDVAVNNLGKVITLSSDGVVILWDAKRGLQLKMLLNENNIYERDFNHILMNPNGEHFILYEQGEALTKPIVCEIASFKKIGNLPAGLNCIQFSPDGKTIVGADGFGGLKIFDAASLSVLKTFDILNRNPMAGIDFVALRKDPKLKDKAAYEAKLEQILEKKQSVLMKHADELHTLRISANGKFAVTVGERQTAILWNLASGKKNELAAKEINDAMFNPEGNYLATAASDQTIAFWDVISGELIRKVNLDFPVGTVVFSTGGNLKSAESSLLAFPKNTDNGVSRPVILGIPGLQLKKQLEHANAETGVFNATGELLLTLGGETSKIWERTTWEEQTYGPHATLVNASTNQQYVVALLMNKITLLDGKTFKAINDFDASSLNGASEISGIGITNTLVVKQGNKDVELNLENATTKVLGGKAEAKDFFGNEKYSYQISEIKGDAKITITDKATKNTFTFDSDVALSMPRELVQFDAGRKFAIVLFENEMKVLNLDTWKWINTLNGTAYFAGANTLSPDGNFILMWPSFQRKKSEFNTFHPVIVNIFTGKVKSVLKTFVGLMSATSFSPPTSTNPEGGKQLLIANIQPFAKPSFKLIDTETGNLVAEIKDPEDIGMPVFSGDGKYVLTEAGDQVKQWSTKDGKLLSVFRISKDGTGVVQTTVEGYYRGDKALIAEIGKTNLTTTDANHTDLKFNRPDKVLAAVGSTDSLLKESYKKAHELRLKEMNLDSTKLKENRQLPEISILNEDVNSETALYKLHLVAKSTAVLKRLNVWINKLPIFGMKGLSLTNGDKKIDTVINLYLSASRREPTMENLIEVAVVDDEGLESYRQKLLVKYTTHESQHSTLYFVGLGINKFADTSKNLNTSIRDIRKMVEGLQLTHSNNVKIDTLFNEEVNLENISAIKQYLAELDVNDRVIIVYSGHGLNNGGEFYIPTYNTDFNAPQKTGIPYSALVDLFDGIPPRYRLMLIDACESGDYNKTDEVTGQQASQRSTVISKNSFELMRDVFVDLQSTGSTIIASSGKNRPSIAHPTLNYGLLIYSTLELIYNDQHYVDFLTRASGKYDYLPWSVSALIDYVKQRIPELSDHMQQPIVRSEPNFMNWDLAHGN